MKIATYNINSIKAHAAVLFDWLREYNPDIVFLQEIKCETKDFLYFECESLGYKVAVLGQKSYNGVAILSKYDFEITAQNLPNFLEDNAMRYLEILVYKNGKNFYVASVYAPNGCAPDRETEKLKLQYKLQWFDKLRCHLKDNINTGRAMILAGDFNIMKQDIDVFDVERFKNSPLYVKAVRDELTALENIGFHDSFRLLHPKREGFTFWDYSANSFVTNLGLRIDYVYVTAQLAEKLYQCVPDVSLRQAERTSDHTALIAEFEE